MRIELNPDSEFVADMKRQLKSNSNYCPSALERTKDTKCMCKDFRECEDGMCNCGLYIKYKE